MENTSAIVKSIEQMIEELACYNNPGQTAVKAAHGIANDYVLIPRIYLPEVEITNGKAHTDSISEYVCKGDTSKMRDMAYQYLAMAAYMDENRINKEAEELDAKRLEVWRELNPLPFGAIFYKDHWKWDNLKLSEKKSITMILDLRSKIDS